MYARRPHPASPCSGASLEGHRLQDDRDARAGHDLLKLFDGLDESARDCIERQDAAVRHVRTHGSVRSVLANHKDDFTGWRYLGESWQGKNPYGDDLDVALRALIAAFHELPVARSAPGQQAGFSN